MFLGRNQQRDKRVNSKHEPVLSDAEGSKLETISTDKNPMFQTTSILAGLLDFSISNFEIVSDFELWISDFD